MEELQTYYQIPSIAHFCSLFRDCLNLPDFDYEDLEFAFLTKISSDDSELTSDENNLILRLICALLKGYFDSRCHQINYTNWEKYLQKLFQIQCVDIEKKRSPFVGFDDKGEEITLSFDELSLRTKVDVINCLCDYRLFADDISQRISDVNADDYRVEPLGTDSKGFIYWYFYGTRLYRENPSVAQNIEQNYKKFDELVVKRAENIKRNIELEKARADQDLRKQVLLEAKKRREEQKKTKALAPKVFGFRTGLRERKSDQSVPNGVCTPKPNTSKTVPNSDIKRNDNKKLEIIEDIKDLKEIEISIEDRREAWALVCQSEQDWKDFTDKFAKSKVKSEIELYSILSKNFVPKITEIFEIREKEKQKVERQKLIELLPRRLSSRIELKKAQKEKEDLEEQEANRRKEAEGDRKGRDLDRQRSVRIKLDREQRAQKRLQLVEERAERALKREKFELDGFESDSNLMETKDFDYIIEDYTEPAVDPTANIGTFYEGLQKVISAVKTNRDAWPFVEPVDGTKFPMYYQVITEPMDLSKIESKIDLREYQEFQQIENDIKTMVNNCETFNGPKNGYTLMAYGVWRAFKKASLKYLEKELTYDESNAFIYPQKATNNNIKPAIEAKKKKIRNKRRSTFRALNVLAEAAEKAVEANESRVIRVAGSVSSFGESSPRSTLSSDSNAFVLAKDDDNKMENSLQIHGDMWANFLFKANNDSTSTQEMSCIPSQPPVNPLVNENLTFKSLDEWSKSIKQSGNYVVLPQHAVIISSPQFTQLTNGPLPPKPQVSLQVVSSVSPNESTSDLDITNGSNSFMSSVISNNENARKELVNTDPKRLVIKLSRCESQQGWRPVTLITSTAQNNINSLQTNGQTITTSAQQFQGLRSIPTNCVPVKKRLIIQDFNKPSMALNMSPMTQNSNTNSQSFQITGIQRNQKTNLKVFRLKKLDQSSPVNHSTISSTDKSPVVPKLLLMASDKQTSNLKNSSSGLS